MAEPVINYLLGSAVSFGVFLSVLLIFGINAGLLQYVTHILRKRWYEILGWRSWVILALPGTVIHELAHLLFCLIFGHKILEFRLYAPAKDGTLGYVNHSWNAKNFWQRCGNLFIGAGPILLGCGLIAAGTAFLMPSVWKEVRILNYCSPGDIAIAGVRLTLGMFYQLLQPELWSRGLSYLWLAGILLIGSHITLSRSDLKEVVGRDFFFLLGILAAGTLLLRFFCDPALLFLKYAGALLAVIFGVLNFILIFLALLTALLHIPLPGKNPEKKS